MIPTKAYILKTNSELSTKYARFSADSCDQTGTPWEYVNWFNGLGEESWNHTGVPIPKTVPNNKNAQCCYSGHIYIWKRILDSGQAGIILEHDGLLLHKVNFDIPDGVLVVLGYKLLDPTKYDHVSAGPPKEIVDVKQEGHEGSHAYAITPHTAAILLREIQENGCKLPIDNAYFLRSRKTAVPIKILSPTPAIGWVRESTIQKKSSEKNYDTIDSFKQHLRV